MSRRILAIDPAIRNTGFAVLEQRDGQRTPTPLAYGTIKNKASLRQSACLLAITEHLREVIRTHQPNECAVEGIIYVQSHRTAITMGAARAAALIAAAEAGLEIREYAPKRVKQSVVGRGAADKDQVAFMVRALLGLRETPDHDAADALAIGLTHLTESSSPAAKLNPPASI
ncbi:crossover junction endodeoxyribonuclease RuvC [Sulfuriroseicoccus oceanibius]|uniref:Crossover junction endodeoxyribonuclease RuvC n=1 Tax=Sulfuriroseicoccus oceanibius TaxID=2707525 RepID=A0A6B3LAP7_9BACT|nr:crossover junction endodeoxyribonuclease RuvC [Sulfuriroseicoccus oceanibius]QQL44978.1 crossover junction endodeoxyribonuclease RuvC [Sulfuriroseicoccus oceanibius]